MTAAATNEPAWGQYLDAVSRLWTPGGVRELRALGVAGRSKRVDSGYFDDPGKLAAAAGRVDQVEQPRGVYLTLNPVQPALLARSANAVQAWADISWASPTRSRDGTPVLLG